MLAVRQNLSIQYKKNKCPSVSVTCVGAWFWTDIETDAGNVLQTCFTIDCDFLGETSNLAQTSDEQAGLPI